MTHLLKGIVAGLCLAGFCEAGTITGVVTAQGKEEPGAAAEGGKYDSRRYKFVERVNYQELRDFVVYVDQVLTNTPPPPKDPVKVITQKDAMFHPHVLPIMAGTTVEWPNNDDIFHNVFSMSETKPFDLGLYKAPAVKRVTFDKPGRVDVFCSIHTKMSCIILVVPTPYFAVTDAKGRYAITNLPPGNYQLRAWHERLPSQARAVEVPADREAKADFTLGIVNLPKY